MEIASTVLTIIYVIACLFLGFVVLIQKGEGGGLGGAFGGGAVDVAFGAKADMTWKRATAVCAALFMILAIVIGIIDEKIFEKSKAEGGGTPPAGASETPGGAEKDTGGAEKDTGGAEKDTGTGSGESGGTTPPPGEEKKGE